MPQLICESNAIWYMPSQVGSKMHNQRQRSDGLDTFCFLFQESLPDRAKFEIKTDISAKVFIS